AHLVGAQQQNLIHMRAAEIVSLLADPLHGAAIRKDADAVEADSFPRLERFVHAGGIFRLDTDDADVGVKVVDVGGNAGDEPTTPDGYENRVEVAGRLPQNLHRDGALPGDHVG